MIYMETVRRPNVVVCYERIVVVFFPQISYICLFFCSEPNVEMCVALSVEYPVTMMNCKTCVILYFPMNIQHKQEYRVSYTILYTFVCVIYVRGHVHHDDNRIQSAAFGVYPFCFGGRFDHDHGKRLRHDT